MELNWIFLNAIEDIDVHLSKWNLEIPLVNLSATSPCRPALMAPLLPNIKAF